MNTLGAPVALDVRAAWVCGVVATFACTILAVFVTVGVWFMLAAMTIGELAVPVPVCCTVCACCCLCTPISRNFSNGIG